MVSVLPCKVTVTFFILLSNEIVCSKSLVRSDMKCILYVIASLFLNSMFTLYQRPKFCIICRPSNRRKSLSLLLLERNFHQIAGGRLLPDIVGYMILLLCYLLLLSR